MELASIHKSKELGRGGFGIVYEARTDEGLTVAVKVLDPNCSDDDKRRFAREVRIQSKLKHDNILQLYYAQLDSGEPFFVMPLASHSLRTTIKEISSVRDEAIEVFLTVANAVAYAHESGVIHRDIKPENILFLEDDVQLSDFGLCVEMQRSTTVITKVNQNLGSLWYMSPEQMGDPANVDFRTDIYSLGKLLYELLTGEVPFPTMETRLLDGGFRFIVDKATRIKPSDRFFSVEELVKEVRLIHQGSRSFLPGIDFARELVAKAAADVKSSDSEELLTFLIQNAGDVDLYHNVVTYLPQSVIELLISIRHDDMKVLAENYCKTIYGFLPFSFVDDVAVFLRNMFLALQDSAIQQVVFNKLLEIGVKYNRYFVRAIVRGLLEQLPSEDHVLIARESLLALDDDIEWYDSCFSTRVPQLIREVASQVHNRGNGS